MYALFEGEYIGFVFVVAFLCGNGKALLGRIHFQVDRLVLISPLLFWFCAFMGFINLFKADCQRPEINGNLTVRPTDEPHGAAYR